MVSNSFDKSNIRPITQSVYLQYNSSIAVKWFLRSPEWNEDNILFVFWYSIGVTHITISNVLENNGKMNIDL